MNFAHKRISEPMQKPIIKISYFVLLIILSIFSFWAFKEWNYNQLINQTNSSDKQIFSFEIVQGEKPASLALRLYEDKFIVSDKVFITYIKRTKIDSKLQAGKFYLSKNLTIPEIADQLTRAKAEELTISFPEGFTVDEIDARLARFGLIDQGDFLDCVFTSCNFDEFIFLPNDRSLWEGYFFPATYKVLPDKFILENFAKQMIKALEDRLSNITPSLIAKNGLYKIPSIKMKYSLSEIIIMASIIEKETNSGDERPMVADIFWKRLENGIPLGADATVRYFTKNKTSAITYNDLQSDNPFNTRKHRGLTPHAICNPGLESLQAAIAPQKNEYWYFLHDNSGEIHYAKNLQEHNQNKALYIK